MRNNLIQIQRIALLEITGCFRTTSTVAMMVLTVILSLDLKLDQKVDGNIAKKKGSVKIKYNNTDTRFELERKILSTYTHPTNYNTISWGNKAPNNRGIEIYTDGPGFQGGKGAAFCVMQEGGQKFDYMFNMSSYTTVFQEEATAVEKAIEWLEQSNINKVKIFSDSQATLKVLAKLDKNNQN